MLSVSGKSESVNERTDTDRHSFQSHDEIHRLSKAISRDAKYVLTDEGQMDGQRTDGRTDGRPENIMPSPPVVGWGIINIKVEDERGLTSHQIHYRSYRGRIFTGQSTNPAFVYVPVCPLATSLKTADQIFVNVAKEKLIKFWKSSARCTDLGIFFEHSSTLQDTTVFHNLAHYLW